jgi:hypothetical protein
LWTSHGRSGKPCWPKAVFSENYPHGHYFNWDYDEDRQNRLTFGTGWTAKTMLDRMAKQQHFLNFNISDRIHSPEFHHPASIPSINSRA